MVAAHGGFGRASRASGLSKATLSRRISKLEQSLGVRLIERGSRSLRLTDEGRALRERTDGLRSEIAEAGEAVARGASTLRGRLRVRADIVLAHAALGRIGARLALTYPEVQLEIVAEDRAIDLVEEAYDLVIRINPSRDERLVGRCFLSLCTVHRMPPELFESLSARAQVHGPIRCEIGVARTSIQRGPNLPRR
jgi:DNA-binding transcriptional LysR family regulator